MWGLTPDQVEQELQRQEEIIARSRGRQMLLLAAADAMQLQTADGCRSFREWAAGRLDISVESASALTATARRLQSAPEIAQQLLEGKITFDRAEAMARIPGAGEDDDLGGVDIRGLHQIAARHRRITKDDCHDSHRSQYLAIQPNLDESSWKMWALLDGYSGAVVDKVLTEAADQVPPLPDGIRPGLGYRRAVALAAICEESRPGNGSTPLITVFVDEDGPEIAAGTSIGAALLDRIACSANLEMIRKDDGRPLAMGRRTRVIPNRLRRFILHRDGGCTGDGCTSRYRLEAPPHSSLVRGRANRSGEPDHALLVPSPCGRSRLGISDRPQTRVRSIEVHQTRYRPSLIQERLVFLHPTNPGQNTIPV